MPALLLSLVLASAPAVAGDLAGGNVVQGHRIQAMDAGTGAAVETRYVVGADGGTDLAVLRARYAHDRLHLGVALPFASYRVPTGRDLSMGNVGLQGWYLLSRDDDGSATGVGVELHLGLGGGAYTWANDPTVLWPGTGADVVFQRRTGGELSWMYRGSIGVHGARGYAPFPGAFLRLGAAAGVDWSLADRFGLVGEASLSYWDTSPFELTGLLRADIVEGLRARAGLVLPLAVWMGAHPADDPAGIRETTLLLDLQVSP